ncbi:MAG TPA: hypothetical protein VK439_00540 [Rubrivivax sp.]|nr:hypothetical protein [Rubrivivax sp.]
MTSDASSLTIASRAAASGSLASLASAAVLAASARRETGSPWAALNAPSHWFWGRPALRRNEATWTYTGVGMLTHHLSAIFWAVGYEWLRSRRRNPTAANAIGDAAVVTALAATVDLKVVPERLTPGFEHRLSKPSLLMTYVGFGVGLALAGLLAERNR